MLDASVAVKLFLEEIHTVETRRFFGAPQTLHAPDFLILEMHSVCLKKEKRKEITSSDSLEARANSSRIPINLVPVRSLISSAYQIAIKTGCSLYDGLYLSLADKLNCQLITADRRLYNGLAKGPFSKNILWVGDLP